jgi:hypothetical protein
MSTSGSTRFEIPADVVARDVAGEIMILHLGRAIYFGLNDVGSRVWQLIEERGDLDGICATMAREFDAPPEQIRADVILLTSQLVQKGLLSIVP